MLIGEMITRAHDAALHRDLGEINHRTKRVKRWIL
jgi:hypothetical protein